MDGYQVLPTDLTDAASVFELQSEQVQMHAAEFLAVAAVPDSAFGSMSRSYKIANAYDSLLQRVQSDLKDLQLSLSGTPGAAEVLKATAQVYLLAESANTLPGRG